MNQEEKEDLLLFLGQIRRDEVEYILEQLRAGRIDGGTYHPNPDRSSCGCMFGALAEKRGVRIDTNMTVSRQFGIEPGKDESEWACRPFEGYTTRIMPIGHPDRGERSRRTTARVIEVIEEFLAGAVS